MPRLDRMATLYFFSPLSRIVGRKFAACVPVLMYHSVSANLFGKSHPYFQINTLPAIFANQMRWLHRNGYRTVGLNEMLGTLASGQSLENRIVLTFNRGYQDFYTEAFPVLRQFGFEATVYLTTDCIQNSSMRMEGADYLTWSQVRELSSAGVRFGSHTATNADLSSLDLEEIDYELGYSKELLEDKIGTAIDTFSYPLAFPEEDRTFARFLSDILENHGFENGVSTIIGRASARSNRFYLPRLPINSWDDSSLLRAKLQGGYDWLHWPQWFHKFVHHNISLMERSSFLQPNGFE
jgi:peptidoglycan/xylan/chitin deacetylase (PgdA/CDA1 family)